MERLTVPDKKIDGGLRRAIIDAREVRKEAMTIYWALKKYEDTELTPEQIMELKERDTTKVPINYKKRREEVMIKTGDKVKMNDKYYVSEKNKEKVFTVKAGPQNIGGQQCVWLDGWKGCYAADGLTKVEE